MLITTNLSVSGPLSLSSVASTTTSLSAMILESGLVKSRPLGSMSLKGDNEYLPQIGLSFPSIFNLNTNALNFANQSLTVSLANQTANTFLSAPNGLSGTPSFRAIVPSDIPTLNQNTTGNAATATSIKITNTTTSGTYYPLFASTTSGNQDARVDTGLTYNPGTDTLSTGVSTATSAYRGGNGTAALPAYSFSGDTNTGIYWITSDTLGFSTAGNERVRVDPNGKVGIGTTNIEGKFHVYQNENLGGTTGNSLLLQTLQNTGGSGGNMVLIRDYALRDATGTSWTTWRHHNSIDIDGVYNTPGANTRTFWERDPLSELHYFGSSNRYVFTVDGANSRVGINVTNPEKTFSVLYSDNNYDSGILLTNTNSGSNAFSQITLRTNSFSDFNIRKQNFNGNIDFVNVSNTNMSFHTNNTTRLTITNGGAMGLGVTPTNTAGRFEASNDIVAFSSSDKNWKKNIKNINSPLEKLSQINGVEFDWIEDEPVHGNKGHDIGVIAQEIEQVLPEIVQTRESGMKAVQYDKIIPLLIESIKEQQKQIDELKQIINAFTK